MLWVTLCAGDARRFFPAASEDWRKQLIEVKGEALIERQYRMVKERGQELMMVTHDAVLMEAAMRYGFSQMLVPRMRRFTCETLLSTVQWWPDGGRLVVLLGDVYYTDDLMDAIAACQQPLAFFGNIAETWAISSVRHTDLAMAAGATIEAALAGVCPGTLRNVYHAVAGVPYRGDSYEADFNFPLLRDGGEWRQPTDTLWRYWSDETCDFDRPEHLVRAERLAY